jgi:uncharacterized repeat protein (TIGR02543 family)
MGNQAQLFDGAFKAGVSQTDSGYYKHGEYKWDPRPADKTPISGNTVNEFFDSANRLHFYILDKHMNPGKYGEFLSYSIGMLHTAGVAVTGALKVVPEVEEAESWNRVAVVNFKITNEGATATDIIRVAATSDLKATLLNDLYAIKPGETVTVPVYVNLGEGSGGEDLAGLNVSLSVASESNSTNKASASVSAQELLAYNVTFVDWDGAVLDTQSVVFNTGAEVPTIPEKDGFTFIRWNLDSKPYDFSTPVTKDITLAAQWERIIPVNFIQITSIQGAAMPALVMVPRNNTAQFCYEIDPGAVREGIIWSVSNMAYATVNATTGLVTLKNLTGTVILTAKDVFSDVTISVLLRLV